MFDKFEGIIGGLVRGLKINNCVDVDDIKQELRLKLVQVLPTLKDVPEDEIYATVKPILRNRLIDIIRSNKSRPDTSVYCGREDMDEIIADGATSLSATILSPDASYSYRELVDRIIDWSEDFFTKDWELQFVNELINPSEDTLTKYEELTVDNPRISGLPFMAPMTLGRVLGLSNKKVLRIMFYLREFLSESGYRSIA